MAGISWEEEVAPRNRSGFLFLPSLSKQAPELLWLSPGSICLHPRAGHEGGAGTAVLDWMKQRRGANDQPQDRPQGPLTRSVGTRLKLPTMVGYQSWGAPMRQICRWHLVRPDSLLEDSARFSLLIQSVSWGRPA